MSRPNTAALARRMRARMTATVQIARPGPPGEWDPESGTYGPSVPIVAYEGPGYVRPTRRLATDVESAGQPMTAYSFDVMVPPGVAPPDLDLDTVHVLTSGDDALTGTTLTILSADIDDWHTARLLVCQRAV